MNPIHPKVANGASLAGLVSPLNILLTFYVDKWSGGLPTTVTASWVALVTGVAYFVGSYYTGIPIQELMGGNGNGAAQPALPAPPAVPAPAAPPAAAALAIGH